MAPIVERVEPEDAGRAAARRVQADQRLEQRGLAGAVAPDEADHGARLDPKVRDLQREGAARDGQVRNLDRLHDDLR
jgi:hypothetical protein